MVSELPLKSVVLFIAIGTMVFVIVFIFAKRQITRFALKSRGPHQPIGADAPKAMKQEIERRLKQTLEIKYEPRLLRKSTETDDGLLNTNLDAHNCHFLYRMKAMDALFILDEELEKYSVNIKRQKGAHCTLRSLLIELRQDGPLEGLPVTTVEKFTEAYDHARHDPEEFLLPQYLAYMDLLNEIIEHIRNKCQDKIKCKRVSEEAGTDDVELELDGKPYTSEHKPFISAAKPSPCEEKPSAADECTVKYRLLDKRNTTLSLSGESVSAKNLTDSSKEESSV